MHAHQRDILSPLSKSGSRIPKKTPPTVQSCRCTCYRNMVEHTRATVRPNTLNDDHNSTILRAAPMQQGEKRDFATAANCHQCRAAARHAACTWSRRCRARPNVETLQSCKRTARPGSGKRVRIAGIATLPPPHMPCGFLCLAAAPTSCAVARPRVHRAHGLTSARAKPAHTRRAHGGWKHAKITTGGGSGW